MRSHKFEIVNLPIGRYRVFSVGVLPAKLWHEKISTYLMFPEAWPAVAYKEVVVKGSQPVSISIQENVTLKDYVKNRGKSSLLPTNHE